MTTRPNAGVVRGVMVSLLAVVFGVAPLTARDATSTPLVIMGGTLIDGTGRAPVKNPMILIREQRIAAVSEAHDDAARDARRLDADRKWIIPGLIDAHVHYYDWMGGDFLRHGVTTVRDVGNNLDQILELRRQSRAPDARGPRLFACGPLIDGPSPRHGTGLSISVTSEEDARDVARRLLARGVDCLKVYEQLTPPLVQAIAQEGHRAGIPVTAHLRDTTAIAALGAGVKGLEHAQGFEACDDRAGAEVSRLLVERDAYAVPTLAVQDPAGPRIQCLKRFVARLKKLGGRVVAGSDTANSRPRPGVLLHRELELLVDAGLSPQEAVMAATSVAAEFLGQAKTLGTIEPGRAADLVILSGDPLNAIANTRQIDVVIRDGRVVWKR